MDSGSDDQHWQSGEVLRQAAVFASGALGTRGNSRLRDIVARAAALLGTPTAAISIIDRDRQWYPAIIGWNSEEDPRDVSFCSRAIEQPGETLCVPDAREDERFATNPLVTGDPHIRFYAGVPLIEEGGRALGALCAIAPQPRPPLTDAQEKTLRALAREAVVEIERIENLRRFGTDAIELVLSQIRTAAREQNEQLLIALDKVLQTIEAKLAVPPRD